MPILLFSRHRPSTALFTFEYPRPQPATTMSDVFFGAHVTSPEKRKRDQLEAEAGDENDVTLPFSPSRQLSPTADGRCSAARRASAASSPLSEKHGEAQDKTGSVRKCG